MNPITESPKHVPVKITAHLAHGVASSHPWGIALDGLLAAQLWHDHTTATPPDEVAWPSETGSPPDLDLPLAKCRLDPGLWHWAATCHQPDGQYQTEVHWRTRQTDHRHLEDLTPELPANVSARQGRYRGRRMPLIVTVCPSVSWSAVGDPDQIQALLSPIAAIGKKRSHGEGTITRWEVRPVEREHWAAAHLHFDDTLGRPAPTACLPDDLRLPEARAGIRPPYMHRSRQAVLHLPEPIGAS